MGRSPGRRRVRMHIASCSKLITAIAMTRTLAAHNLPASTPIIDYLPTYWAKGPNIDKITFAQLMTHTSGFRVTGSDTFYRIMKTQVAAGVTNANLGAVLLPEHELQPVQNPAPGHERRRSRPIPHFLRRLKTSSGTTLPPPPMPTTSRRISSSPRVCPAPR